MPEQSGLTLSSLDPRHAATLRQIVLQQEIDAATGLLAESIRLIRDHAPENGSLDPLFACLSMAMERLLKLTIGLHAVESQQAWPTKKVMQKTFGHNIVKLWTEVQTILASRAPHSTHEPLVREALANAENDPILPTVIGAMDAYARDGRYHRLDLLADSIAPDDSPGRLWEKIQHTVAAADPEVVTRTLNSDLTAWERATATAIENAIMAWFHAIHCSWIQGSIGDTARRLSALLRYPSPG